MQCAFRVPTCSKQFPYNLYVLFLMVLLFLHDFMLPCRCVNVNGWVKTSNTCIMYCVVTNSGMPCILLQLIACLYKYIIIQAHTSFPISSTHSTSTFISNNHRHVTHIPCKPAQFAGHAISVHSQSLLRTSYYFTLCFHMKLDSDHVSFRFRSLK